MRTTQFLHDFRHRHYYCLPDPIVCLAASPLQYIVFCWLFDPILWPPHPCCLTSILYLFRLGHFAFVLLLFVVVTVSRTASRICEGLPSQENVNWLE